MRDLTPQQAEQVGFGAHGPSVTVIIDVVAGLGGGPGGAEEGRRHRRGDGKLDPNAADVQQAAADGQLIVRVQRRGQAFYAALHK